MLSKANLTIALSVGAANCSHQSPWARKRGWLLSCFHCSRGLRCFYKDQNDSPCPKQLLVPAAIIISNFLDVLDMSSNVSEQRLLLNNNKKTPHVAVLFFLIRCDFLHQFGRSWSQPAPPSSTKPQREKLRTVPSSVGLGHWAFEMLGGWSRGGKKKY